ncbi:TetR/AcrR family transcriptional regulator [Kitasatospora atroaurantiaca]
MAEICARADVRKGSFYHFFDSKQALTLAAVDSHWTTQRTHWNHVLSAADTPPLARLRRLLDDQAEAQRRAKRETDAVHGCLFGNLALELSNQEWVVQSRLAEIFDEQIAMVQLVLAEAAAEGAVAADRAGRVTARAVLAQLEGIVMLAKLGNNPAVLDDLWATVRLLIGC